ncbi:MAG TPA: DUF4265 domain-containing protein [Terriglobales bacterium]|nr:DUF4265 domain-containing protein [Terriglobales bacterium]
MSESVGIVFQLDRNDQQSFETERLWAAPVRPNEFRILNSPFFVFGVSAEDIVSAVQADDGVFHFQRVVERGGHSTYRVFLQRENTIEMELFLAHWNSIRALGVTFEAANNRFISIDIPPSSDMQRIYGLLQRGESEGVWVFEEGNYEATAGRVA